MLKIGRLIRSFYQLLLPVLVLLFIAAMAAATWFVYSVSTPPTAPYLVTPAKFAQLSSRGAQITDETWSNADGSAARGWLLKGAPGAPAVVLLHRYGTDRSHLLNIGVKLSEATNFTVLMPDLRGHGPQPDQPQTSFSGCEIDDVLGAIKFLKSAKVEDGKPLVGKKVGLYGVEIGALIAIGAAARNPEIQAIALESVPRSSSHLLGTTVAAKYPFGSFATAPLSRLGTYPYFAVGCFNRELSCTTASSLESRDVLLLAGPAAEQFQTHTSNLSSCFPESNRVKAYTDLTPSGFDLTNATLEQADFYDQRVIYFFKESLANNEGAESEGS